MNIEIRIPATQLVMAGQLDDSHVARDFASLLPLTVTLEDYASAEKISGLPKRLSTTGSPAGTDAKPGDICYYAPWGNLAVFYRKARYADGLIKLGVLQSIPNALRSEATLDATIVLIPA